ncbi:TcdA/TcdB catalytic glycosyltransferase domain-containing protein [Serratia fonticola]|uniref:TcdA/TcdB catalytic glycosyltransferase domain-containing protein n=1 Tax=Serratia fonticola TaxID=47917 RepID=UPI00301C410F
MKKLSDKIATLREKIFYSYIIKPNEIKGKHSNELLILLDILKTVYVEIISKSSYNSKEANINSIAETFSHAAIAYESGIASNILKSLIFIDELFISIENNFHDIPMYILKKKLLALYQLAFNSNTHKDLNNKLIHFIWIGEISKIQLKHVELWAKRNNDYRVMLWMDPKTLLAGELLKAKKATLRSDETSKDEALRVQRQCWYFSQERHIFNDEIIAEYLTDVSGKKFSSRCINKVRKEFVNIKLSHLNIKIMDINTLISKYENRGRLKIYNFEIFYRTNLAAASDVIRLLVLSEFGGIYIDIDTLPKINIDFPHTDRYLTDNNLHDQHNEKIEAMKNTMTFEKFWQIENKERKTFESNDCFDKPALFNAIKKDLCSTGSNSVFCSLKEIKTPFDIPLLSRHKKNINVFFSNVIVANSNSTTIDLSLKIINENYRKIFRLVEKNIQSDFIFNYALDGYKNNSRVTLNISGPGVLLRAIFLTIIDTLELPQDIPESALLGFLNTHLSFTEQTMETESGLASSWMK